MFYYVFIHKYSCDISNKICKKLDNDFLKENDMYEVIQNAMNNKWFKDENRQLAFFATKIKELSADQ